MARAHDFQIFGGILHEASPSLIRHRRSEEWPRVKVKSTGKGMKIT